MITIIVPSYNEARNVAHVIDNIATVFSAIGDKRVVIVDDGSTDDTEAVVRPLLQQHDFIELVRHPRNLGLGAAVRSAGRP